MRRRAILLAAATITALIWSVAPLETGDTVALAKVLTNYCGQQSEQTMRMFGTAVLNRVGKAEYGETLRQVLRAYPTAFWYDERSMQCARELLGGSRGYDAAPEDVVHAVRKDEDQSPYAHLGLWRISGDYVFYYRS